MSPKRRMPLRIRNHLSANGVSYIALLIALSGTAYSVNGSLPGKNTVDSADIISGEVKSPDVGTNQVRTADVRNQDLTGGGLAGEDIADEALTSGDMYPDTLGGLDFLNGSLLGEDFVDGSVTGTDIDEGTLAKVPSTRSADSAGTGRFGDRGCDPESAQFVECVAVNPLTLVPGRVLVVATVTASTEFGTDEMLGACRLSVSSVPYPSSRTNFDENDTTSGSFLDPDDDYVTDDATLVAVTDVLQAGNNSVALECNQGPTGAIIYWDARISTMTLSPN